MGQVNYAARLRYLDADDVNDALVKYDGLPVYGSDGSKIGNIDGFIIDADARRVTYVVIDSGGWFTSRRLLLPIGHATVAQNRQSLTVDVTQEALRRLPEYEEDRFPQYSDDELRAFERNTVLACCPDEPLEDVSVTGWGYDSRRHYQQPDWWRSVGYAPERLRPLNRVRTTDPTAPVPLAGTPPTSIRDTQNPDLVTARDRDDMSPHFEGRAQPGDVLGIETGGERTGIGETSEEENKRHRRADKQTRE